MKKQKKGKIILTFSGPARQVVIEYLRFKHFIAESELTCSIELRGG